MKAIVLESPTGAKIRVYLCSCLDPLQVSENWESILLDIAKSQKFKLIESGPMCSVYSYPVNRNPMGKLKQSPGFFLGAIPWAQSFAIFTHLAIIYNGGRLEAAKFEETQDKPGK